MVYNQGLRLSEDGLILSKRLGDDRNNERVTPNDNHPSVVIRLVVRSKVPSWTERGHDMGDRVGEDQERFKKGLGGSCRLWCVFRMAKGLEEIGIGAVGFFAVSFPLAADAAGGTGSFKQLRTMWSSSLQ
ncbi:hypothetical protein F2Q68_00044275 [Brassica cretica]|uniref:Uncharacterized protein n=1 Tax=Brassica cretica TaxID=69181 RepID=A0A8S9LPC3_BRACR|nr:hypothetical protein F2Q68_00044275 [Brassica cretica]